MCSGKEEELLALQGEQEFAPSYMNVIHIYDTFVYVSKNGISQKNENGILKKAYMIQIPKNVIDLSKLSLKKEKKTLAWLLFSLEKEKKVLAALSLSSPSLRLSPLSTPLMLLSS